MNQSNAEAKINAMYDLNFIIFQHLVRNEEGQGETTPESRPPTYWEAWKKFGRNMRILMPCMYPIKSYIPS